MILNLVPPTRYTFDQIGLGQTLTVQLVSNIDVSSAREVTLICRLHGKNLVGTGTPELMLALAPSAPFQDGQSYVGADGPSLVLVMFDQSVSEPDPGESRQATLTDAVGGWVNLAIIATNYDTSVTDFEVTLSVDLALKA
jgi:hypothetical protein